ncbi:MAG: hypothetical protein ACTS44_00610 [Candidatus Hodgkinia cicadicola]
MALVTQFAGVYHLLLTLSLLTLWFKIALWFAPTTSGGAFEIQSR